MKLQLRHILLIFPLLTIACSGDGDDSSNLVCQSASTQACTCTDGSSGAQSCSANAWLACVCDGSPVCQAGATQACVCPNDATGTQSCSNSNWGSCACESPADPGYGEICRAPNFQCDIASNLFCITDNVGDSQGICRVPCQNDLSCVDNDLSWNAGDTDCCNVLDGSSACVAPFTCPSFQ